MANSACPSRAHYAGNERPAQPDRTMQSVAPLLVVGEEHSLSAEEVAAFGGPLIENAAPYLCRARPGMHSAFATVRAQGSLIGLTPLITLARYRSTRLLKPDARRWL